MNEKPTSEGDAELRRRYLEALEHKKAGHGSGGSGKGAQKASGATANTQSHRMFRRKSG